MSDALSRRVAEVNSLVLPDRSVLLRLRALIQQNPKLELVFEPGHTAFQIAEQLAPLAAELMPNDARETVWEAAQYLADEFEQLHEEGTTLVISRDTGRAIAKLRPEDIWTPPMVPREDGRMVPSMPRMRPEIEGFLVQYQHDRGREGVIQSAIVERIHQTSLLREDGDNRLRFYSAEGRKSMTDAVREALPEILKHPSSPLRGTLAVQDTHEGTEGLTGLLKCRAFARVSLPMVDLRYRNIHHDPVMAVTSLIRTRWAREIARTLTLSAIDGAESVTVAFDDPGVEGGRSWVLPPELAMPVKDSGQEVLAVEGAHPTSLRRDVGIVVVDSFECHGRDIFDRWEVGAAMTFTLYLDWSRVRTVEFTGLPEVAIPAALVS